MKKLISLLILTILFVGQNFGQSNMVVGKKHTIIVDIPENWLQAQNYQLPFFIKPDKKEVSSETYMYVYGIDYNSKPELSGWIKGNNDYISDKFKGVKIDTLNQKLDNIKSDDYLTGNYLPITYEYPNGRNEVILVIECKNTIVTAVLSTKDKTELNELLPSFIELSKTLRILGTVAQTNNNRLVDSLKFVSDMPYICHDTLPTQLSVGCGDQIFWRVVKQKQDIIPFLLDKLSDTTQTAVPVPNFGGQYTVADIAYTALLELIKDIPTFELLGVTFDKNGCGYCSYWNHLQKDIKYRKKFQTNVRNWYDKNKTNLVWVKSNQILTCDCAGRHPNGGHFELKQ